MPEPGAPAAPTLRRFVVSSIGHLFRGPVGYWLWTLALLTLIGVGGWHYLLQLRDGLVVTNMTNQVSWGFYIANFTFLVGVAAAAVMLVVPAYIFHRRDIKDVVLMGDTMAIAAVTMAILFVVADLGRPDRFWHLVPVIGEFNFPQSMLAWDVVVLNGYLLLNLGISFYIVYNHYLGRDPKESRYFPWVLLAIFWAISIHTVTAFLYSANSGRPYWNNALLAPRFIASAFASGPAMMAIGLQVVRAISDYPIRQSVIHHLSLVTTIALQVTLFFLLAELFTEFYNEGEHAASARYLFLGLDGHSALTPWIWSAIALLSIAVVILMIHPLRRHPVTMNLAFAMTIVGVWIEKGMGLVIPAFVPTPIGEIYEYTPSATEIWVSVGIWAFGLLLFTLFAKAALPVQCEFLRRQREQGEQADGGGLCRPYPA
jgi:Ni/Fe-hydrogenase subunit HybB-like protein